MPALPHHLTIGELAARSGVRPSALRFYEQAGLVSAERTAGNQRRWRVYKCAAYIDAAIENHGQPRK